MARNVGAEATVVIGLGRFGESVARKLSQAGTEVMALDFDPELVDRVAPVVTFAADADCTSTTTLRELGAADCPVAVVAIGENLEASILAASSLVDLGVPEIWARATSPEHGRILQRLGVHHVIYPEQEVGARVAELIHSHMQEYVEVHGDYAVCLLRAPGWAEGRRVSDVNGSDSGARVIGLESHPGQITLTLPDQVIDKDALLVVAGQKDAVLAFPNARRR
jgi:trk system potassium uptake protein